MHCVSYFNPTIGLYTDPSKALNFHPILLTSTVPGFGNITDPNMIAPMGMSIWSETIFVATRGKVLKYNMKCEPLLPVLIVEIPNVLHDQIYVSDVSINYLITSFRLPRHGVFYDSYLIMCTTNGTIHAYCPSLHAINTHLVLERDAMYTSLIVTDRLLYVTDFKNGWIDVFDRQFNLLDKTDFPFMDPDLPGDYSPYKINVACDKIFLSYARRSLDDPSYVATGYSNGLVSVFDAIGQFICRFTSFGNLNVPTQILESPSMFGYPAGAIIICNSGDGIMNIYSATGKFIGSISNSSLNPLMIPGLAAMVVDPLCSTKLYWCAKSPNNMEGNLGFLNNHRCI